MIPIVCLDDKQGMMFNNRRQSMDEYLREDVIHQAAPKRLWMNSYSLKQFMDCTYDNIVVNDQFLDLAQPGDYCFIEDQLLKEYLAKIEKIIVYHWNRIYPSDLKFDLDLKQPVWKLISTAEIAGKSHPIIYKEVFVYEEQI